MAYEVVNRFKDKENEDVIYEVGETYPKGKYKPPQKRIKELSEFHRKYKKVFIKEIKD